MTSTVISSYRALERVESKTLFLKGGKDNSSSYLKVLSQN